MQPITHTTFPLFHKTTVCAAGQEKKSLYSMFTSFRPMPMARRLLHSATPPAWVTACRGQAPWTPLVHIFNPSFSAHVSSQSPGIFLILIFICLYRQALDPHLRHGPHKLGRASGAGHSLPGASPLDPLVHMFYPNHQSHTSPMHIFFSNLYL